MSRMSTSEAVRLGLISEKEAAVIAPVKKVNKYGVSTPDRRTFNGRVYASRAEMLYAVELSLMAEVGTIVGFAEQPRVQLGPDTVYKPDFVVVGLDATFFVDIKGAEPPTFTKVKKLWAKYMRVPLHIVRHKGSTFAVSEIITRTP